MRRHVVSIRELGEDVCWLLVQQAMGIPDAKMQSDFMAAKVALLVFARKSLPERLCVTAAVRQMSGTTVYAGDSDCLSREEVRSYQRQLWPIFGYYLDCMYLYGFSLLNDEYDFASINIPLINAGGMDAHPVHALADLACMLRVAKDLKGVQTAWIGCDNGTLHSLIAATAWFPINLRISLPPEVDSRSMRQLAADLKTPVAFVESPLEAARDASFIFAGRRDEEAGMDFGPWSITTKLMSKAADNARILLSASPLRAIPIEPAILESNASLLSRQAEYRLRIHKRILHWVFSS